MRSYGALFKMSARESFAQRSTIIGSILLWCLRVLVLMGVYSVAFHMRGGSLRGMDFVATLWSIGVYFIVLSLSVRHVAKEMSREIRLGNIETKLNKPINYLFAAWATQLGRGVPHLAISGSFIILFYLLIIGPPTVSFSLPWAVSVGGLFIGGVVLALLFYGIIGLCAVWIEVVDPLYWILDKGVMVLGGAYIPVALFPTTIRAIGEHTPFGAIMFITHIFNPDFGVRVSGLFATQVLWIGILCVAAFVIYKRAMRHVSINGG